MAASHAQKQKTHTFQQSKGISDIFDELLGYETLNIC